MKNLVFPRIFLHCVALGFIVSGLLLSERPWVRIPPGTPKRKAAHQCGFPFWHFSLITMFIRSFVYIKTGVYPNHKRFDMLRFFNQNYSTVIVALRVWPPFAYGLYGLMRTVYVPASRLPRSTFIPSETVRT